MPGTRVNLPRSIVLYLVMREWILRCDPRYETMPLCAKNVPILWSERRRGELVYTCEIGVNGRVVCPKLKADADRCPVPTRGPENRLSPSPFQHRFKSDGDLSFP